MGSQWPSESLCGKRTQLIMGGFCLTYRSFCSFYHAPAETFFTFFVNLATGVYSVSPPAPPPVSPPATNDGQHGRTWSTSSPETTQRTKFPGTGTCSKPEAIYVFELGSCLYTDPSFTFSLAASSCAQVGGSLIELYTHTRYLTVLLVLLYPTCKWLYFSYIIIIII